MNKLIIFDMDGVLFDSIKLVNDYMMRLYPTLTEEIMSEILSGNFHDEVAKLKGNHKTITETPEEKQARQEEYSAQKMRIPLYDGMRDLLVRLHSAGYILAINTSVSAKNCLPLLENSKIKNFFDFIATTEISKSKVEKFKIIEDRYKISKESTVFITDTLGDIREANTAEVKTIAVTWGAHKRAYFTHEPYKYLVGIVDSVAELEAVIPVIFSTMPRLP